MYDIQSRWKLQDGKLQCYGLRTAPHLFDNTVRLSRKQQAIVKTLPRVLNDAEKQVLGKLIGVQIVKSADKKAVPTSLDGATFCTSCVANDFIIPGIEFDAEGRCPMCQTVEQTRHLKSVVPIKNTFAYAKKSRFDIAVFYTGGKDSTYLLYYLSKVLHLRVLAMTWEIPYMSDSARKSIENAKTHLDSVEFITRKVANDDLRRMYRKLYALSGNTCACPSLAYVLFYPELVANRVPYFVVGNEPAQMLGLYYNHMAPPIAYTFPQNKLLNALLNVGRVLTLRPPLKEGQFHTLATMKQLAHGDSRIKNMAGYSNELVSNVCKSLREIPHITRPLGRAIRVSSVTGNIPAFVQVDFDAICGGVYEWNKIKELIVRECGWVAPEQQEKGLHTSCVIENCKEYTQFVRFYRMESTMIPFSAIEISLATRNKHLTREQALAELRCALGFSLDEPCACAVMREYIEGGTLRGTLKKLF